LNGEVKRKVDLVKRSKKIRIKIDIKSKKKNLLNGENKKKNKFNKRTQ
jgi:hypothetical protein